MLMVPPSRIKELAEKQGMKRVAPVLHFASECYDEGMVEILEEVAQKELYYNYDHREPSPKVKQASEHVLKQYQALEETLNEEQKDLLRQYDDASQALTAFEAGEEFIHGFVRGYRYLKQEVAHGMG